MSSVPYRAATLLALLVVSSSSPASTRLKELVEVQGVRDNELLGYGLVMGLANTGDTTQVFFTQQTLSGMLGRMGVRVDPNLIRSRNVAAVMVTARMPTFSRPGTHLDVSVSSMGDARSLAGGVLLMTPLSGPDGVVYALAQGPLQVGGFTVFAAGSLLQKNQTTSARIAAGATVERAVTPKLSNDGPLLLTLHEPDFTTATRVEKAMGTGTAKAIDPAGVELTLNEAAKADLVGSLAKIELLEVETEERARVVINERTGTVVAGARVRLRPAAIAHGGLRVSITTSPVISQPAPFARVGTTVSTSIAQIDVQEESRAVVGVPSTNSVNELVKALNTLGATPRDLVAILQALKAAGSLDADLEVL
jgi:flagellar P-ring protein precursor FlgI